MKPNKYLSEFIEVVSVLKTSEIELARKHINAYRSNHTIKNKKMLILFNNVNNGVSDYDKLKRKVSKDINDESFNRLIIRTTKRILESLLVDVNIGRKEFYSDLFQNKYKLQKMLVQSQILRSRGLINKVIDLNSKIIKVGKEYELYSEIIEAMLINLNIASGGNRKLNYDHLKNEIFFYEKEKLTLQKIRIIIQDFSIVSSIKSNSSDLLTGLKQHLHKVEKLSVNTTSKNSLSIKYLFQIEYYSLKNNYKRIIEIGTNLLELLKNYKSVYSEARIIYVQNEISNAYLNSYQFDKARNLALNSFELSSKNINSSYLTTIDLLSRIEFYSKRFDSASIYINKALSISITDNYKIRKAKFNYYQANLYFVLEDYKRAYQQLDLIGEIERDKEGWNLWIRTLRILCLIEQKKFELLEFEFESFRKYVDRNKRTSNQVLRIEIIVRIISDLIKNMFNFNNIKMLRTEDFDLLKSKKSISWKINSPEMIDFSTWFESKTFDKKYLDILYQTNKYETGR